MLWQHKPKASIKALSPRERSDTTCRLWQDMAELHTLTMSFPSSMTERTRRSGAAASIPAKPADVPSAGGTHQNASRANARPAVGGGSATRGSRYRDLDLFLGRCCLHCQKPPASASAGGSSFAPSRKATANLATASVHGPQPPPNVPG